MTELHRLIEGNSISAQGVIGIVAAASVVAMLLAFYRF